MKFLFATVLATFALAHFDVIYPEPREENEELEEVAPCGGGVLSAERNLVPLNGTRIGVISYHRETYFDFRISFAEDPQTQADFNTTVARRMRRNRTGQLFTGQINYARVGAQVGQNATIQIAGVDDHVAGFRCIDVTFV
jgi:hypothetical protein